jgi:tRNA nucleotidyltransferase (CCA-adding enzyme)
MAAAYDAVDDLVAIARAEGKGARLAEAVKAIRASGAPLTLGDLALDGSDLKELGITEGPAVGDALRALLDRVLEDPGLNTRASLEDIVRSGITAGENRP